MNETEQVLEKFDSLKNLYGWSSAIIMLLFLLTIYFVWKYLTRAIEKSAEVASEKTIKKFQAQLDKELAEHNVKFSTRHQKQIDAIHEIYSRFENLFKIMNFMMHGDKYYPSLDPHKELNSLILHRTDFIRIYGLHKIVLPIELCQKIENLIPSIEEFIDTYKSGLFPKDSNIEVDEHGATDEEGQLYLAGIWKQSAFDETLKKLETVKGEIESEFRKIYGT